MKHSLFALLAVTLFSCAQDADIPTPAEPTDKQAVQFNLGDFIRRQSDMQNTARKAPGDAYRDSSLTEIANLYYVAYDASGTRVSYKSFDTLSASFGTINDSLAAGNYTILVAASTGKLLVNADPVVSPEQPNINFHALHPFVEADSTTIRNAGDIFLKKFQFEVTANGSGTVQDLSLERVVGKITVEVKDALPATHPYNELTARILPTTLHWKISNGDISAPDFWWTRWMTRVSNTTFQDYLFGSHYSVNVVLYYKDKNTGAAMSKTINNVPVTTNKVTSLSGFLYGGGAGTTYQIKVNQAWSGDTTVVQW